MREVARNVAKSLGKSNADQFTGHCFRSSSATEFVNNGGTMENLKRLGNWRSMDILNTYVKESEKNIQENARLLISEKVDESEKKSIFTINFHNCSIGNVELKK